jgi:hypothetical protein
VDATNVYVTTYLTSNGQVLRCSTGGCPSPTVMASGQDRPNPITADANAVYWTDFGSGLVMKVAK